MTIVLKPNKDKFLRKGYPWVFRNLVDRIEGTPTTGDVVRVTDASGHVFGQGFYHAESQIAVRFLTRHAAATIDADFLRARVLKAYRLRQSVFGESTHCRVIYGESDGMPGTIVDRYGDVLTWSTLCYGMEQRREVILDALTELYSPAAIVERNDNILRDKDGLPQAKGVLRGTLPDRVLLDEDGVKFEIDVLDGLKTGFFIDQRVNRRLSKLFARDRAVLDVFCADGGFGLHAAAAGATSVYALDSSQPALDRVKRNAEINGLQDRFTYERADAMDRLEELANEKKFGMVILDPPAFAKGRRHRESGIKAYQRININGFRLLEEDGILVTSSCSQAIDEQEFLKVVRYSAKKAGVSFRILARGFQPPDHPVLDSMEETSYLKLYVVQKLSDELPA
ncbi:MAG: class I SAM-dependent rRNA methyltransferase [Rhodothermales bacterium]|nr:class I SAM-dependent rRNA methyltransferase [Rhodothermales bacterium]